MSDVPETGHTHVTTDTGDDTPHQGRNVGPGAGDVMPRHGRAETRSTARQIFAACSLAAEAAPGALALYVTLTLATGAFPVVTAWLTKSVLDGVIGGAPPGTLITLGAGLAATGVAVGVIPQMTKYLQAQMDRKVGLLAQDHLFAATEGFVGLGNFEDPPFLDRIRLAQQSGGAIPNRAVDGLLSISQSAVTITGFTGSLFLLSPVMTVLVLASGVPTLAAQLMLSRRRARMIWDIGPVERREMFYSDLLTSVRAAKEIRLFGIGAFFRGRMLDERGTANAARQAMDRREVCTQSLLGLTGALVSGGGLLWAVNAAGSGGLSVGDITIFIAAVAGVQGALGTLADAMARTHQALLLFDHYLTVIATRSDLPVARNPRVLPELREGIEFRDVWFRYSDSHPWILRGVDLHIPHGRATALVGLNGAGKSTLVKLLCRFYDPTRGAILWDGVDLRDVDAAELRKRIGAAFQDYMEYDLTAAENIALGDLDALGNHERIQRSAKYAGIHDKIMELPRGYDSLLSRVFFMESEKDDPDTGVAFSGGQWQRLALARAFLRDNRELMILDEPSSGLDAQAEHEMHTALRRHRGRRTSLLISHRLGAVREADLIVVLSGGRVIEQGDHSALMTGADEYARLFTLQASGYQTGARDETAPTGGTR
ncbi:ABC transporter ATP-binding protein [Streptosporangium sp. NPDC002721]|uniref:ABC transporter ATP-binding protein n=1 Tax=Streptosporangium sp. NPDC002721 TaxID=3366188 RepID=UPI0036C9F3F1